MSNIFDNKDENKLVQEREIKPAKGSTPSSTVPFGVPQQTPKPSAPQQEQPIEVQQPQFTMPQPIPFIPPVGYGVVPSANYGNFNDDALHQLQSQPDPNAEAMIPLLQERSFSNPNSVVESGIDLQSKAKEWTDRTTGAIDSQWSKYVTHTKVGVSPATEFDSLGNVKHTVSEDEIRTGLSGITSGLGRNMQKNFDKNGWWGGTIQAVQGFGSLVQNVYGQLAAKAMDASDFKLDNKSDIGNAISSFLFQGNPEMIKSNQNWIEQQNRLFHQVTMPSLKGQQVPEGTRERILQETPVNSISDFRGFGSAVEHGLWVLSLPENLIAATVYTFADNFKGAYKASQGKNFGQQFNNYLAASAANFKGDKEFKGNRFVDVLMGRDLGLFNRWTSEKYLSMQEPEGLKVGTMTGNPYWDLPEALGKGLRDLGLKDTDDKYLHWALQGVPAFIGSMVTDAPLDNLLYSALKSGKQLAETKNVIPTSVPIESVAKNLTIPDPSVIHPVENGLVFIKSDYSGAIKNNLREALVNDIEIKGSITDLTPNANKSQIILSTLEPSIPSRWIPSQDLEYVYRSNEDLARQANRMGIKQQTIVFTDAEMQQLARQYPTEFARYGKSIPQNLEEINTVVNKAGQSIPIQDVYPRSLSTALPLAPEKMLEEFNKSKVKLQGLEAVVTNDVEVLRRTTAEIQNSQSQLVLWRDSVPSPLAYTENIHLLPSSLHSETAEATQIGSQYLDSLKSLENSSFNTRQLMIEMDSLEGTDEIVQANLRGLPNTTRGDMQDIQGTLGHYGQDDLIDRELTKPLVEVPKVSMTDNATDDGLREILGTVNLGVENTVDGFLKEVQALRNMEIDTTYSNMSRSFKEWANENGVDRDALLEFDNSLDGYIARNVETNTRVEPKVKPKIPVTHRPDLLSDSLDKDLTRISDAGRVRREAYVKNRATKSKELKDSGVDPLDIDDTEVIRKLDADEFVASTSDDLESYKLMSPSRPYSQHARELRDALVSFKHNPQYEKLNSGASKLIKDIEDYLNSADVPEVKQTPEDFDSLLSQLKETISNPTSGTVNEFAQVQPAIKFAKEHPEYGITDYYEVMNKTKEFTRNLEEQEQGIFIAKLYGNLLDISENSDTSSLSLQQKSSMMKRFVNYYLGDLQGNGWDGWEAIDITMRKAGKLPDDGFYNGRQLVTKTVPSSDIVLYHGTKTTSDIRTWNPEVGSGSHELGKGIYLTRDPKVAEAAASKFQYDNVPVNINGSHTDAHVKVVSTVNATDILDLNRKATRNELLEALSGSMPSTDFMQFYSHFKKNSDGTFGQLFDSLRTWGALTHGSVDELDVHKVQDAFYRWVSDRYDMGRYIGKDGTESWVAYNPSKLVNVDALPVAEAVSDPVIHALEAKRFLDDWTHRVMGNDVSLRNKLESTSELISHQQTEVAQAYAEEAAKHQENLEVLMKAKVDLTNQVRKDVSVEPDVPAMVKEADDELKKTDWENLRETSSTFRKLGNKIQKKIQRLERKLASGKLSPNEAKKVAYELKTVMDDLADIETGMTHGKRLLRAVSPKYTTDPDNLSQIQIMLNRARIDSIDPNWFQARGSWINRKALERGRDTVQRFVSTFISDDLGGDIGKIRQQIFKLKRVGSGQFVDMMAELDMHETFGIVKKQVTDLLEGTDLNKGEIDLMISDLAELQSSPYILDKALADTNTAKLLQSEITSHYVYYMDKGVPKETLDEISEIVRQIPQSYYETKRMATQAGINFGDEQTLGYLPREMTKTVDFMLGGDTADIGVGTTSDILSSRTLFNYAPEDSRTIEVVMNYVYPHWKDTFGVSRFEDLVGDDGALIAAFSQIGDDNLLMLSQMGVLKKVPFTKASSMKYISNKFELPFRVANDIYVRDPQRAFQIYKRGLVAKAEANAVAHGLIENVAHWTVNQDDLLQMTAAESKIYKDWLPMDKLPSSLTDTLVPAMRVKANKTLVHPMVAQELHAMYHFQTSPLLLGMLGDTMQTLYKGVSSGMLATSRWVTMQLLGNSMNLVKRNINPQLFFHYSWSEIRRSITGDPDSAIHVRDILSTDKGTHAGGKYSQAAMHDFAVQAGLIGMDSNMMGKGNRPVVGVGNWGAEMKNSAQEFVDYVFGKGTYYHDVGKGASSQPENQLVGIFERLNAGTNTVMDETIVRFLGNMNQGTDDAFRFALLDAVTKDSKATLNTVDGFQPMMTNLPHFNDVKNAIAWVEKNSYMFDEVQGGGEQVARWVMPFYSFRKLSIQETARWVASNPNRFASYLNLVNSTQNNFEKEDSAAWQQISGHPFYENQSPIPVKIPSTISASGQDEYYIFPLSQYMTSMGAVGDVKELLQLTGFDTVSRPPSTNSANKLALPKGLSTLVEESPFVKSVLALVKPDVLLPEGMTTSVGTELKSNYAFGLNKIQYEMLKVYARPLYTAWKLAPESMTGKAPELNRETGEYTEGTPDMFTGKPPNWSPSNSKSLALSVFGDNLAGQTFKTIGKLSGLAPVNFDLYLSQESNLGLINNQKYQAQQAAKQLQKMLRNSPQGKEDPKVRQAYEEMKLLTLYLNSESQILETWRKLKGIPHSRAVRQIKQENLKVSDLLPQSEQDRIYKENFDKFKDVFQD